MSAAWDSIKSGTIQESFLLCGITAAVDGSENAKMFSHVPCVALEENSDEEPSYQEADNDESSAEDKGMVPGDDFEGLDSDVDPFDTDLTYS